MDFSLDKVKLQSAMEKLNLKAELHFFEETSSTFDEASRINPKSTAVIVARRQTGGRGRLGRAWQSDGGGIYMSLVMRPAVPREELQLMTAICAVGIKRAIGRYTDCMIKWPNDIISKDGKKLCGILTKLNTADKHSMINVGIGINANNEDFTDELIYASSISMLTGKKTDENILTAEALKEIFEICENLDTEKILDEYKNSLINIGKRVSVLYPDGRDKEKALCIGIDGTGALIVRKDDGTNICLNSGEVSVRGVYGEYA